MNKITSNVYDLSGEYGIGYTAKGEKFLFDKDDFEKIKNYCWSYNTTTGYLRARDKSSGKTIKFHRLVMAQHIKHGSVIDHIIRPKGNTPVYDNRKSNLRVATFSQNAMNGNKRTTNKSGVIGVCWAPNEKRWRASLVINGKQVFNKYYKSFTDAVNARKDAEQTYFGEYAYKCTPTE